MDLYLLCNVLYLYIITTITLIPTMTVKGKRLDKENIITNRKLEETDTVGNRGVGAPEDS